MRCRRRSVDDAAYLTHGAPEREPNVTAPATVLDEVTGAPVLVTVPYRGNLALYRAAVRAYPMRTTMRAGGFRNVSRVFGYVSANQMLHRTSCRTCGGAEEAPTAHATIAAAAGVLAEGLRATVPSRAEADAAASSAVRPEWRLHPDAWWTSGVVNYTSPLPYHRDGNNFNAWSAMVILRRGVRGGHLHIPEYDLTVACRDGDVVYFNGSDLLHGVTPMRKASPDGYRYSCVYYAVAKMAKCLSFTEELARGRAARSSGEDGALARQRAMGLLR